MKSVSVSSAVAILLFALGCGQDTVTQPPSPSDAASTSALAITADGSEQSATKGLLGYEPAYYDGDVVLINAIELAQNAPYEAQADLYEVVYPIGWDELDVPPPQCNPCDHEGNGIDFTDYHDHVLDSIPRSPGHGEYSPLWHVFVVLPAYNHDATHDQAVSAAYAQHLPITSEEDAEAITEETLPDGSPIAVEIDTNFYFLCSVVNEHAPR